MSPSSFPHTCSLQVGAWVSVFGVRSEHNSVRNARVLPTPSRSSPGPLLWPDQPLTVQQILGSAASARLCNRLRTQPAAALNLHEAVRKKKSLQKSGCPGRPAWDRQRTVPTARSRVSSYFDTVLGTRARSALQSPSGKLVWKGENTRRYRALQVGLAGKAAQTLIGGQERHQGGGPKPQATAQEGGNSPG